MTLKKVLLLGGINSLIDNTDEISFEEYFLGLCDWQSEGAPDRNLINKNKNVMEKG